jgi:hypothetical protein
MGNIRTKTADMVLVATEQIRTALNTVRANKREEVEVLGKKYQAAKEAAIAGIRPVAKVRVANINAAIAKDVTMDPLVVEGHYSDGGPFKFEDDGYVNVRIANKSGAIHVRIGYGAFPAAALSAIKHARAIWHEGKKAEKIIARINCEIERVPQMVRLELAKSRLTMSADADIAVLVAAIVKAIVGE